MSLEDASMMCFASCSKNGKIVQFVQLKPKTKFKTPINFEIFPCLNKATSFEKFVSRTDYFSLKVFFELHFF